MRIRISLLLVLAVVLLSSIDVGAEKNAAELKRNDEASSDEKKISTSLKISGDNARNRTEKVQTVVTTVSNVSARREPIGKVTAKRGTSAPSRVSSASTSNAKRSTSDDASASASEEAGSRIGNGNRENATRGLTLPADVDIAKILAEDASGEREGEEVEEEDDDEEPEQLPEAQELRYVRLSQRRRPLYRPPPPRRPTLHNRRNVYTDPLRASSSNRPSRRPETKKGPTDQECTFFTKTVCLEATDYPHDAIRRSLRSNKEMTAALLTDFKVQNHGEADESLPLALPLESKYENRYESNEIKRRSDVSSPFENVEEGFTCPSIVKYARPQLARAASGIWKYIINTGEHTQTVRLEKCSNPRSSCSFISENYRSSCVQVYNYHRLLTWDSKLGLHMDIFKVPTCCSCHVHGYAEIFPPHQKDPPQKPKESFPGADFVTANDQKDDFEDLTRPTTNYINKYNPVANYDSSLVSSVKKPVLEVTPSRPSFGLPTRTRPKKPAPLPRPYDKVPQQHAPNTRAPGYTGPLTKGNRPNRPSRPPFRRESTSHVEDYTESPTNSSIGVQYSQPFDQEMDASSKLQNGGFDEEYQEPQRRINYNYHPIIDFFRPEASMLQSAEPQFATHPAPVKTDSNSWKPLISP